MTIQEKQHLEALERRIAYLQKQLQLSERIKKRGFAETCKKKGLKDYHFAFPPILFDAWVKTLNCSPNKAILDWIKKEAQR